MSILDSRDPMIDLPKDWPRLAKSAIVHAVALAHFVIVHVRGWCANSPLERVRLRAENERLRSEVAQLREELRIKDGRLARVPPPNRPHYPPVERLAVLGLKAARGWTTAQAAERFGVVPATIASWLERVDDGGPDALVQTPAPVNRYPDFLRYIVARLKAGFPKLGTQRIANMLARAGLHVARTTIRRLLKNRPARPTPEPPGAATALPGADAKAKRIISRHPDYTWLVDLTIMPTTAGFWVPWLPFTFVQRWPFCWWVAVVVDHFSRAVVGRAVFDQQPTAAEVLRVLDAAKRSAGRSPKYIITDRGPQFGEEYEAWCRRRGVRPRFGAVGQHGSIAVIERFVLTIKEEGLRRILVPLRRTEMLVEADIFVAWYNVRRPHMGLAGATPNEVYRGLRPARAGPRYEIRPTYPVRRRDKLRRKKGTVVRLVLGHHDGRAHLPVIHLRPAA
jgi:transposase InsO family protein